MPKCFTTWTVLPHRPVQKLEPNLWRVEGDLPRNSGTRVMTVVRHGDGGLLIHNGIALEPDHMAELEAFGRPAVLVVPSGYHRLDARIYKERYPALRVVCPAGARKRIEQVVAVDATYAEAPGEPDARLAYLPGIAEREGVLTVRSGEATTLVFNDVINNLPPLRGLFGFLFAPTGVAAVPRFARWTMVKDKAALGAELERLADTPRLRRLIVAHGRMIEDDPAGTLRAVAARLGG